MTRHELREHIFRLLFMVEFHGNEDLPEQAKMYFEELGEMKAGDHSYIEEKYKQIKEKLPEIDAALNEFAKGWTTERMGKAELSILRLAVYELRYDEEIPTGVAINEAVELAKQFGGDEAPVFVNGILAKMI